MIEADKAELIPPFLLVESDLSAIQSDIRMDFGKFRMASRGRLGTTGGAPVGSWRWGADRVVELEENAEDLLVHTERALLKTFRTKISDERRTFYKP